jgi:hypothetical protein
MTAFFTSIEVDGPRYVRFALKSPDDPCNAPEKNHARMWLTGQPLEEGNLVALDKGIHPLMLQVSMGECGGDGKTWIAPRFTDETAAYRKARQSNDETSAWRPEYAAERERPFVLGE